MELIGVFAGSSLTLPRTVFRIIFSTDLPAGLVINLKNQHDREVASTRRSALLGTSSQQRGSPSSQQFRRRIVVRLLDVPRGNDPELLVSFVVGPGSDPTSTPTLAIVLSAHSGTIGGEVLFALSGNRLVDPRGHVDTCPPQQLLVS
jgi:hypothetical protein